MPVIRPLWRDSIPYLLVDKGQRYSLGWQDTRRRGSCFVVVRFGAMPAQKVLDRFPLTPDGWAKAWAALVELDPEAAQAVMAALDERPRYGKPAELAELDTRTLVRLPQVALLGGYAPDAPIAIGDQYDARFLEDRLAMCRRDDWNILAEVPYSQIEDVEIGGPGLVKSGGGFIGGGFGAVGALEGMAVAAVLNALTTRTTITTILRVQASTCELFLLWTKATPAQLRIELSRPLGAIRAARAAADQTPTRPASPVAELSKLADMLQAGLLTREEFNQLKAELLHGPGDRQDLPGPN